MPPSQHFYSRRDQETITVSRSVSSGTLRSVRAGTRGKPTEGVAVCWHWRIKKIEKNKSTQATILPLQTIQNINIIH